MLIPGTRVFIVRRVCARQAVFVSRFEPRKSRGGGGVLHTSCSCNFTLAAIVVLLFFLH